MRRRMTYSAPGLIAALMMLGSCAGTPPPALEGLNEAMIHEKAAVFAAELALDPRDEEPVANGIEAFLVYLAQEYGTDFVDALPKLRRPGDLNGYFSSRDELTTYSKILDAFATWDRQRKDERWDDAVAERTETAHFVLLTMPGTAAHRERDFIARLCEEYLEASAIILRPDEASAQRFQSNMAALSGGKVVVELPPSSRAFGRFNGNSTTNYGFSIAGGRTLRIQATIRLPYYNALSTADLAHEIVHVRDSMQKIDLATAPAMAGENVTKAETKAKVGRFKDWAQDTFARIVPNDRAFGEGIAEYGAARINPIRRSFCLPPEEELGIVAAQVRLVNDIFSQSVTVKDRRTRLARYSELHSFVAYLIESYGQDRFLDFYLRVPPDEANFIAAYGTDFAGMQIRWNEARR